MRSVVVIGLLGFGGTAAADTVYSDQMVDPPAAHQEAEHEAFIGLDTYGMASVGLAIGHEDVMPSANYDYALRFGHVFRASDRWRPGGFVELHSFDLETFDAAIGPQVQWKLGDQLALQLRGGVGAGSEGTHALAGVHVGTFVVAGSLTARRSFESGDLVVSANIEVVALVPIAIAIGLIGR